MNKLLEFFLKLTMAFVIVVLAFAFSMTGRQVGAAVVGDFQAGSVPAGILASNVTTTTTNLGSPITIVGSSTISMMCSMYETTNIAATGGNVTYTFARSMDGTVWEVAPRFTWVLKSPGTNPASGYFYTNFTVGYAKYLKLISIANACSNEINSGIVIARQPLP